MDRRIYVNGIERDLKETTDLSRLLKELGYSGRVSVWLNQRQLKLAEYPVTQLHPGDDLRILRLIGGG